MLLLTGERRGRGTVCLTHSVIMQRPKVIFDKSYLLCLPDAEEKVHSKELNRAQQNFCISPFSFLVTMFEGKSWVV